MCVNKDIRRYWCDIGCLHSVKSTLLGVNKIKVIIIYRY